MDRWNDIKAIFSQAVEMDTAERQLLLQTECGNDNDLRRQVERLLNAHDDAGTFLAIEQDNSVQVEFSRRGEASGDTIGRYRLIEEIGEGGFGIVYKAEQIEPVKRHVALKIIKLGMDTRRVIARFEAERQTLASMDHPNIARVLDAGTTDSGRPYFVMELVPGLPITEYCDALRLPTRKRLELFIDVCRAVQHAHQKGIIHRDIKPSNVLVSEQDGRPLIKVIDFGISKAFENKADEPHLTTHARQFVGTPRYVSPEQAQWPAMDVDTRSDVYSLGVVLYEMLVGCGPYDLKTSGTPSFDEMRQLIVSEDTLRPSAAISQAMRRKHHPFSTSSETDTTEPRNDRQAGDQIEMISKNRQTDPQRLKRELGGELDWIMLKVLQKHREHRYQTAMELAEDLDRYLHNQAVTARPPSAAYLFRKFTRRNRALVVSAVTISGVIVCSAVVLAVLMVVAHQQRDSAQIQRAKAEEQQAIAEQQREVAQWQSYVANLAAAEAAIRAHDVAEARRRLMLAPQRLRNWEWHHLYGRTDRSAAQLVGHQSSVKRLAISPDGTLLASIADDATIMFWDMRTKRPIHEVTQPQVWLKDLAFSADGRLLATLGNGTPVRIWNVQTGELTFELEGNDLRGVALAADHATDRLYTASASGSVDIWQFSMGRLLGTLQILNVDLMAMAIFPERSWIACAGRDGTVVVYDWKKARITANLSCDSSVPESLAFSHDGSTLIVGMIDGTLNAFDMTSETRIASWPAHTASIRQITFHPTDDRFVTSSNDRTVRIWDANSFREIATLNGHTGTVTTVVIDAHGQIFSGANDMTIRHWLPDSDDIITIHDHTAWVYHVAIDPGGEFLVSGGGWRPSLDGTTRIRCLHSGKQVAVYQGQPNKIVFGLGIHPTMPLIAIGQDRDVAIVDFQGVVHKKLEFSSDVRWVEFSPDGSTLGIGFWDNKGVSLFDVQTWENTAIIQSAEWNNFFAFHPEGNLLAMAADQHSIVIRERNFDGSIYATIEHPLREFQWSTVTWSPSGRWLGVTWAGARSAHIWDMQQRHMLTALDGHSDTLNKLAFSPDETRVATASHDGTVRLWDLPSGREVLTLHGHNFTVLTVTFSPDGRLLATGSGDTTIRLWDSTPAVDDDP